MDSLKTVAWVFMLCFVKPTFQFLIDTPRSDIDRCPNTVVHKEYLHTFREKCYEFVIYKQMYWLEARHDCQHKGGDLVVIDDLLTQDFIMETLRSLGNTHDGIWIGLNDRDKELHWVWVNGEPLTGYSNWAPRQGGANILHLTQDCAQIRINDQGRWHDKECHLWPQTAAFICEFEMLPPLTTTTRTTVTFPTSSTTRSTTTKPTTKSTSTTSTTSTTMMTTATTTTTPKPPSQTTEDKTVSTKNLLSVGNLTSISPISSLSVTKSSLGFSLTSSPTSLSPFASMASSTPEPKSSQYTNNLAAEISTSKENTQPSTVKTSKEVQAIAAAATTTTMTTTTTTTTTATSSTVKRSPTASSLTTSASVPCSDLECSKTCLNGYSELYVGLNGCIYCKCN